MFLQLLRQVFSRTRIGKIQSVLVDQHGLVLDPALPCFLGYVFVYAFAEVAGIGRHVEPLRLAAKLDAFHHSCHCHDSVSNGLQILTRFSPCVTHVIFRFGIPYYAAGLRSSSSIFSSAAGSCTVPSFPSATTLPSFRQTRAR